MLCIEPVTSNATMIGVLFGCSSLSHDSRMIFPANGEFSPAVHFGSRSSWTS
jgi:hypothetical protein